MAFYLDENINIGVSIGTQADSRMLTYKLQYYNNGVWENKFVGNVFVRKGETIHYFYLNDLIASCKDKVDVETWQDIAIPDNMIGRWKIAVVVDGTEKSALFDVYMAYRYPNKNIAPYIGLNQGLPDRTANFIQGYNHSDKTLTLYPRLPYIISDNFVFSVYFSNTRKTDVKIRIQQEESENAISMGGSTYGRINMPLSFWFGDIVPNDGDLVFFVDEMYKFFDVAVVDKCPAKYYLLWQDRMGGMQSQPFNMIDTYSEGIEQRISEDYTGIRSNIGTKVTSKWKLQTGWINQDLYPYYESIYVSPYLKLYSADMDKVFDVVLTDTDYTEKTYLNQGKKQFNLEVNVELNKYQNILY